MKNKAQINTESNLTEILEAQKRAFNLAPNPDWNSRKDKLIKLGEAISAHESEFQQAISEDFGNRAHEETTIAEIVLIAGGIKHALKHTPKWMRPRKAAIAMQYKPASNQIIPQPLGVVGIISPWNYPLQLAIMPLIGALGAGNRAMIKPSEFTPRTAALMKRVLASIFSDDEVHVALGGVEVATQFSALPFDHLIFTGSTKVGRFVAQAAAKNLTPVTLELGGKSPVIIDPSADMELAVARIASGKLLNSGQTCVASDYVLMPSAGIDAFADSMIAKAETFYPTLDGNPDYTSIIADSHYARLQNLLEDAEAKGAKLRIAGNDNKQNLAQQRRIPFTVLTDVTDDMKIMQEEIFGPLLPIVASETLDDSLDYIQSHERPLALYWFGRDKAAEQKMLTGSISGGVSINETTFHIIQEDLPFGGVGASGTGAYHGEHGFKTFSHMKGVFSQTRFSQAKMIYPPYTDKTRKMLTFIKKYT